MKNMDSSVLFKLTSNLEVSLKEGTRIYSTNVLGPIGMYLCPDATRTSRANKAKISAVIEFCSANLSNRIKYLIKFEDDSLYYEDDTRAFFVNSVTNVINGSDKKEDIDSRVTYALAIGALTFVKAYTPDLKSCSDTSQLDEQVFSFCDYAYYKVAKGVSFSLCDQPIEDTLSQLKRAMSSSHFEVLIGESPEDVYVKSESSSSSSKTDVFEEYKSGEKRLPYSFDCDDKDIVSLSFLEDFVPTKTFYNLAKKIEFRLNKVAERMAEGKTGLDAIKKDFINIRLAGSPGTGKTYVAQALSAALGLPFYSINIQKNTEEEEFEGKTRAVDGAFNFVTTDFLKGYENGGIIVLEEANLADPGLIMGALGQAIEPPFYIKKNGYETIHRHPMTIIIVTQNIGTNGSKPLNQAFENRLYQNYLLTDPTKEEVVDFLEVSGQKRKVCEWVYNAYSKIKNLLCSNEIAAEDSAMCLSVRSCFGALQEIEEGIEAHDAVWNSIGGQVITSNYDLYEPVKNTIYSLPNLK